MASSYSHRCLSVNGIYFIWIESVGNWRRAIPSQISVRTHLERNAKDFADLTEFQQIQSPRARLVVADKRLGLPRALPISICLRPASLRSRRSNGRRALCCFRLAVSRGPLLLGLPSSAVYPVDELVLHGRAGDERTVGFHEDQLIALPSLSCNVIDPPFPIEIGNLRCTEVR